MQILVTGGAGYIGSHACKALAAAGHVPVTVDNLSRGFKELVKWGPLEQGDVLDGAWLKDVIARYTPAAVFHFAGYICVSESVAQPELYRRNNVEGFRSLLDAMQGQCAIWCCRVPARCMECRNPCRSGKPIRAIPSIRMARINGQWSRWRMNMLALMARGT